MADKTSELKIGWGLHTIGEVLEAAQFDFAAHATVDYGAGEFLDHRLVRVGGLSFDSLDKVIDIPESATKVEIEVDGELKKTLVVDNSGEHRTVAALPDSAQLPS